MALAEYFPNIKYVAISIAPFLASVVYVPSNNANIVPDYTPSSSQKIYTKILFRPYAERGFSA
jgi:hypothetical protein